MQSWSASVDWLSSDSRNTGRQSRLDGSYSHLHGRVHLLHYEPCKLQIAFSGTASQIFKTPDI